MSAVFDDIIFIVTIGDKLASRGVCHRIPWLRYDYYGSLVMVYVVICCNGTLVTLHFLPYHPLPLQRLKCTWKIWGVFPTGSRAEPQLQMHLHIFMNP